MEVTAQTSMQNGSKAADKEAHIFKKPSIKPKRFSANEAVYKFPIFPKETWTIILDMVKDPNDLQSMSNSALCFREELKSRQSTFLFGKVFKVMAKQYDKIDDNCYDDIEQSEKLQGSGYGLVPETEKIWNFPGNYRLVCSSWNKGVEDYYQKPTNWHFKMEHDLVQRSHRNINEKLHFTMSIHDKWTESFMQTCFQTGENGSSIPWKNPFLQRSLSVKNLIVGEILSEHVNDYLDGVRNTLQVFGHELNYVDLSIEDRSSTTSQISVFLKGVLSHVPNVKVLKLKYLLYPSRMCSDFKKIEPQENDEKALVELKNLEFFSVTDLPASIFNEIMETNHRTVKQLEIESWLFPGEYDFYSMPLQNLTKLSMYVCSQSGIDKLEEYGKNWKLTKFHCVHQGHEYLDYAKLFKLIEGNWKDSLKDLYLEMTNEKASKDIWEISKGLRLNLPKLERMALNLQDWCSLDFLLTQKKLRVIEVNSQYKPWECKSKEYENAVESQLVEFLGFELIMEKSNIWNLFPELECISIMGNLNTRPSRV